MPLRSRRWPQYLAASTATLAAFAAGTMLSWTSPAVPLLQRADSPFRVSNDEASWIAAILPLGAVVGSPLSGLLVQKWGRKMVVQWLAGPLLASWLVVLATRSALWLYVARLLGGLALGGVCVACPIYVAEVSEDDIRGQCGSLLQVMFNGGMLFSYAVGAVESYSLLSCACAALPVVFLAAFACMPETPFALLARDGGEEAASRSLCWLRRWKPGEDSAALEAEIARLQREHGQALAEGESPVNLSRRAVRRALIIALGLVTAQQLSGVCAVLFYAETIFRATGTSISPSEAAASLGVAMFVMSLVTSVVVDRVGASAHAPPWIRFFMGMALSSLAAFFQLQVAEVDTDTFAFLPTLAIIAFVSAYCLGLGPLPWTVITEVLPPDIKGTTASVVSSLCYLLSFVVTKSFQSIVDTGTHYAFWLFAGFCGLAVVFVIYVVPETKGKSLEQIQIELTK